MRLILRTCRKDSFVFAVQLSATSLSRALPTSSPSSRDSSWAGMQVKSSPTLVKPFHRGGAGVAADFRHSQRNTHDPETRVLLLGLVPEPALCYIRPPHGSLADRF